MIKKSHLQVMVTGNRDEGVQQYRGLLDPSLLDQPLPKAQKPATYDEEIQGGSPQGEGCHHPYHETAPCRRMMRREYVAGAHHH